MKYREVSVIEVIGDLSKDSKEKPKRSQVFIEIEERCGNTLGIEGIIKSLYESSHIYSFSSPDDSGEWEVRYALTPSGELIYHDTKRRKMMARDLEREGQMNMERRLELQRAFHNQIEVMDSSIHIKNQAREEPEVTQQELTQAEQEYIKDINQLHHKNALELQKLQRDEFIEIERIRDDRSKRFWNWLGSNSSGIGFLIAVLSVVITLGLMIYQNNLAESADYHKYLETCKEVGKEPLGYRDYRMGVQK